MVGAQSQPQSLPSLQAYQVPHRVRLPIPQQPRAGKESGDFPNQDLEDQRQEVVVAEAHLV